jgi:hypothetical protein
MYWDLSAVSTQTATWSDRRGATPLSRRRARSHAITPAKRLGAHGVGIGLDDSPFAPGGRAVSIRDDEHVVRGQAGQGHGDGA